jgi:hypothetical protein
MRGLLQVNKQQTSPIFHQSSPKHQSCHASVGVAGRASCVVSCHDMTDREGRGGEGRDTIIASAFVYVIYLQYVRAGIPDRGELSCMSCHSNSKGYRFSVSRPLSAITNG